LNSLRASLHEDGVQATVWVVDNASQDETVALVRERHPWVHLEALPQNLGYVKANNLALAQLAKGMGVKRLSRRQRLWVWGCRPGLRQYRCRVFEVNYV